MCRRASVAQVRRTKEMLSANTAAPLSVEELYDGKDFQVGGAAFRANCSEE